MGKMDFFGPGARFDHVGIGVKSIDRACVECEKTFDPIQKVSVAFASLNGLDVELVQPEGEDSPVTERMKKGSTLLHLCYSVPDIDKALEECRKHAFHRISRPVPAVAFDNRRIVWVYSNMYGLFELLEDGVTRAED